MAVFEIEGELEFGRLKNRQIGGLLSLENTACLDGRLTMSLLMLVP